MTITNKISVRPNIKLPEILEKVSECANNDEKLIVLKKFDNRGMRWFVNAMYNFDFSGMTIPDYKQNNAPIDLTHGNLSNQINRLEAAIKNYQKGNKEKYDDLMVLVLENVSKGEAKLIENLFSNRKIDGVSKSVWKRLYPEFFRIT